MTASYIQDRRDRDRSDLGMSGIHSLSARRGRQKDLHGSRSANSRLHSRRQKKSSRILIRGIITIAAVFILFLILNGPLSVLSGTGASVVRADQELGEVQYKLVEIHKGDSLWSIARENMGPGYSDIYDYIREIRACNQLETNDITSGGYLMIPYYGDTDHLSLN